MFYAAAEGAALNVKINLSGITDQEFVGWHTEEVSSILRTCKNMSEGVLDIVRNKMNS